MPIKKAAFKHLRQTKVKTAANTTAKNKLKTVLKTSRKALLAKDKNKATDLIKKTVKALDKAAQHKLIKKNKASRLKSRLSKQLNKLS